MVLLKGQEHRVGRPQCQKKGSFQVGRGAAFWSSVGFKLNWNLMCGMWNSGSSARCQESTECEGFFFSSPLPSVSVSLSLSLPPFSPVLPPYVQESLTSARRAALEAHWRIESEKRYRQREGEGLPLWHPCHLNSLWNSLHSSTNKWSEGIKHLRSKSSSSFILFLLPLAAFCSRWLKSQEHVSRSWGGFLKTLRVEASVAF